MRDSTHLSECAAHVAVEWAAAEGWNPGVDDERRFLAADPEAVFETARMYRNGQPPEDRSRVFGVTTFELG
jgi:hypothetical protein